MRKSMDEHLSGIVSPWRVMTGSAVPWQKLTTPEALLAAELPDDVVTIEIRSAGEAVPLESLAAAILHLDKAYSAIVRLYHSDLAAEAHLRVLSIQSGSPSVRVDCQGMADCVKHLKDFILEAWRRIRHKRADELLEKNSALLASLGVLGVLRQRVEDNSIAPEEAEKLKQVLLLSAIGIFEAGALPIEMSAPEIVDNQRLLREVTPKLLTSGSNEQPGPKRKPKRNRGGHAAKAGSKEPAVTDDELGSGHASGRGEDDGT